MTREFGLEINFELMGIRIQYGGGMEEVWRATCDVPYNKDSVQTLSQEVTQNLLFR